MTVAPDQTRRPLDRLTANERECLRRRLLPQTAKEMALELGISPHAVEKRLKLARAKLGVSSSLAAARLLAAAEDRKMVPQSSDLSADDVAAHSVVDAAATMPRASTRSSGGRVSILVVILAALLPQASVPSMPDAAASGTYRPASPAEVRAFVHDSFVSLDRNRSGFIERDEAPVVGFSDRTTSPRPTGLVVRGSTGQGIWMVLEDKDRDDRVSEAEYVASRLPFFLAHGVPVDWRAPTVESAEAN